LDVLGARIGTEAGGWNWNIGAIAVVRRTPCTSSDAAGSQLD
jgi:hypothetical protein